MESASPEIAIMCKIGERYISRNAVGFAPPRLIQADSIHHHALTTISARCPRPVSTYGHPLLVSLILNPLTLDDESPFAQKAKLLLSVRKIPYHTVTVARIPPRPELQLLGIDYRRIPVLAINETVYCDTFMIGQALEELYPDSEAHPSLYPKNQTTGKREHVAFQKLLVQFWTDRVVFGIAAGLLPWKSLPKEFVKDREAYRDTPIDPNTLEQLKPYTTAQLKLHLEAVEEQLIGNKTDYLFDTAYPGYLDISVYFILDWLRQVGQKETLFGGKEFPTVWMDRVEKYHKSQIVQVTKITGQEANKLIGAPPAPPASTNSTDGHLFGIGTQVMVVPDDVGKIPTYGTLVGLDREKILLDVQRRDSSDPLQACRVCFPRIGFLIVPQDQSVKQVGVGKI
ncbi:hypothetical protein CROQUDRAFT_91294 [Cronartium quercuum f. sp. fusiforme G11]|uniref:GST N-terminal domain-containing protein n=1 Tax=Cronartium quercuum f. sp. fusiforme G11 TaxID=708437 RepID=A0A9P6NQ85_9BASI|nr:hypothetical protein CROQUDRAFT_91294 [Cronartium quercuum f. sp. fusiforme G11]